MSSQRTQRDPFVFFGFFGFPQSIAAILLTIFLAQCAWFIVHVPLSQEESNYVSQGISHAKGLAVASDQSRGPLVSLTAAVGVLPLVGPNALDVDAFWLDQHRWFIRTPFLLAGFLLAASIWFVARRMFGNQGAYVALGLYCFSPGFVAKSSTAGAEIFGAWGAFGIVFTSIAVAHTLYAPREVVLWNWKRILILAVSIAMAVSAQWVLVWVLVPALGFMLWAVPQRKSAAVAIMASAIVVASALVALTFGVHVAQFAHALRVARWADFSNAGVFARAMAEPLATFLRAASPASILMLVVALGALVGWRRTRFFGNVAPLIVAAMLVLGFVLMAYTAGALFLFYALPFVIVFDAGVFADLFESESPGVPYGVAYGAILTQAVYSVVGLMRVFSPGA